MDHNRKEPVLEEALEENEDAPLLLTNLVREGLPPPLWRHEEPIEPAKSQSKSSEENPDKKPAPTEKAFSMQWEEAQASAAPATKPAAAPHYAQSDAYLQDAETPPVGKAPKDFEDNDLEAARNETTSDGKMASVLEAPVSGIVSDRPKLAPADNESSSLTSPEDREVVSLPADSTNTVDAIEMASISASTQVDPEPAATEPEKTPVESVLPEPDGLVQEPVEAPHVTAHNAQDPALDKSAFDLDFLKDFEQLLFQEIERRVMNELEEKMIQHLQTAWKEQVSLTMMRTLALEGIKLRESLAQEMRKSLPEILQRVLHNGLVEQIIPNEAD